MNIVTRQQAKEQGLKRYFTGKPCKHGHREERLVSTAGCVECAHIFNTSTNKKILNKQHYENNKDEELSRHLEYRKNNKEKISVIDKKYRKTERGIAVGRAKAAKRRSIKLQATPKWLSKEQKEQINAIYDETVRLQNTTGIEHNTDHMVPLVGPKIDWFDGEKWIKIQQFSGLHVPWNLRPMVGSENKSKSNKLDEQLMKSLYPTYWIG